MKFLFTTIFLIILLILPACENGVVISYNPDDLESVRFIKTEKIKNGTNELNCEYGDASHTHQQDDSYYVYFTLTSANASPVNPENPKFSGIQDSLSVEFQVKDDQGNFKKDDSVQVGKIEYLSPGKDLKERQNFNFLIDVADDTCLDATDKNRCALSGGLTNIAFGDMLNKILTALSNMYNDFENDKSFFIEDEFLGVKYFAFSAGDSSNWFVKMISRYITDIDGCSGSMTNASNKRKIQCWLELSDSETYRGLKNESSKYHRKLWDAYVAIADEVKSDSNKNKNILLFTSGYEEAFYDSASELSATNKSVHSEDEFFNAISSSDNIPVFIAPEDRSDTRSFPVTTGTDIDDKFYKLACLTNGAYFPYVFKGNEWIPTKTSHYSAQYVMGNIKDASYGMWRVKITLNSNTTERFYDGGLVVKAKSATGEDIKTGLAGYRIVR